MAVPWLKSHRFAAVLFANLLSRCLSGLIFMYLLVFPALQCHAQASGNSAGNRPYLETPYSTLVPFEDEKQALTLNPAISGYYRNLTSLWKVDFTGATGAFAVAFDPPESWQNRQTFLCFSVLKTPVRVLVNGKTVETLQKELPAKLNITSFLQTSGNLIELQALGGKAKEGFTALADSAYAFSGANIHVKDIEPFGLAGPDVPRACFEYKVQDYKGLPWYRDHLIYYLKLYNHEGKVAVSYDTSKSTRGSTLAPYAEHGWARFHPVPREIMWSAERPYRHTATHVITDRTPAKAIQEVYTQQVGLRQVSIKDKQLHLNGTPIRLHPVRYELPAGNVPLPDAFFESLAKELKQHNVNTLILSGDPLPYTRLFDICDRYGLYVMQQIAPKPGAPMDEKTKAALHALKGRTSLLAWLLPPAGGAAEISHQVLRAEINKITYSLPILEAVDYPTLTSAPKWNQLEARSKSALRRAYQPATFQPELTAEGKSTLKVVNRFDFIPLEQMRVEWQVLKAGEAVQKGGTADVQVVTNGFSVLPLPLDLREFATDPAYSFSFRLIKQEGTAWSDPDHELAMEEFVFSVDGDKPLYLKKIIYKNE